LFEREKTTPLEPVNASDPRWVRSALAPSDPSLITSSGDLMPVLAAQPGTVHALDLGATLAPWRTSRLRVPLWASHTASAELLVGDETVARRALSPAAAGATPPQALEADITASGDSSSTLRVSLLVLAADPQATVTVPLGPARLGLRPAVVQQRSARRWLTHFGAPALIWLTVLAGLLSLASFPLRGVFGSPVFATLTTAAVWFGAIAGVSNLVKIDLHAGVRRLLDATGRRRRLFLALTACGLVVLAVLDAPVLGCTYKRWRYTERIDRYTANEASGRVEDLVEALAIFPWRAEAPLLLQRYVATLRLAGREPQFRAAVSSLVAADSGIRDRIERAREPDACLSAELEFNGVVTDPAIWFALLLPEGESMQDSGLKQQAQDLLRSRSGAPADVARGILALDVSLNRMETVVAKVEAAKKTKDGPSRPLREALAQARAEVAAEEARLRDVLEKLSGRPYPRDSLAGHLLQEAWDHLGDARRLLGDREQAILAFRHVLFERERQRRTVRATPWLRLPSKLFTFAYFRALAGRHLGTRDFAVDRLHADPVFRAAFVAQVYGPYEEYKPESAWYRGTIFEGPAWDERLRATVNEKLLSQGWKY
jgi:hypothetical protein